MGSAIEIDEYSTLSFLFWEAGSWDLQLISLRSHVG